MCKISAFTVHDTKSITIKKQQQTLARLFLFNSIIKLYREGGNSHATGFCIRYIENNKTKYISYKAPIDGEEFVLLPIFDDIMNNNMDIKSIIVHARLATTGSNSINDNNHPVTDINNQVFLVHNGVVSNHTELFNKLEIKRRASVDSEILPNLMALKDYHNDTTIFAMPVGWIIAAALDRRFKDELVIINNVDQSGYFVINDEKLLVTMMSTKSAFTSLKTIIENTNIKFEGLNIIVLPRATTIIKLNGEIKTIDIKKETKNELTKSSTVPKVKYDKKGIYSVLFRMHNYVFDKNNAAPPVDEKFTVIDTIVAGMLKGDMFEEFYKKYSTTGIVTGWLSNYIHVFSGVERTHIDVHAPFLYSIEKVAEEVFGSQVEKTNDIMNTEFKEKCEQFVKDNK